MKTRTRMAPAFASFARFLVIVTLALTCAMANAAPRPPQPPWPQQTVRIYGFDAAYWRVPWNDVAVNEDPSTLAESWSGYALVRDGWVASPVLIPVASSEKETNLAMPYGAIRFWFAPNYSTASEKMGGHGPGHLARLLELVTLDAQAPQVQWSLYVNETGDTIYLSGQTKDGVTDVLKAPVELTAGDWRMVTIGYSPSNTALWLDTQLVATGEGLSSPQNISPAELVLVIGSDLYGSMESLAHAQFEELTTLPHWPRKSDWPDLYFAGTKPRTLLGPIPEAEAAALAQNRTELKAKLEAEGDRGGGALMRFASSGPSTVCITNGPVYLTNLISYFTTNNGRTVGFDIVGGTNGVPYDVFSTTNLAGNSITNAVWQWEDVGYTCNRYTFTNQPDQRKFFILGTPRDTDGDGLTDAYELLVSQTRSNTNDTDGDGLPDGWEVHNGLNPLVNDAGDDPDGDWLTNLQEYHGGTNATNPRDVMVVAWGNNTEGQCNVPLNLRDAVALAGGMDFSLALRKGGGVTAWGTNNFNQTNVPANLTNAVAIAAGPYHGLALGSDQSVTIWGGWWPDTVSPATLASGLTNIVGIAAGASHDLALRMDGTVTAWGYDTNTPDAIVPTNLNSVRAVAAGWTHSVALRSNGTLVAWGYNTWGQTNVPGLSNVTAIAAGAYHTLALKSDGTVVAWGLGFANTSFGFDQGQCLVPTNLSNVVAVAANGFRSLALKTDGTIITWGDNYFGQSSVPPGLSNVLGVAAGTDHSLAIRSGRLTPLILEQPASQTKGTNFNATFSINAIGGLAGLKYQWQFNGVDLTGATNATLSFSVLSPFQQGYYRVIVSTGAGAVTSTVVTLRVLPGVPFPSLPVPGTNWIQTDSVLDIPPGILTNLAGPATFQWKRDGVPITGAICTNYYVWESFGGAELWEGDYSVDITSASGTTNVGTWRIRLLQPGSVMTWGENADGQGDRPAGLTNTLAIAAGRAHGISLQEDGRVRVWGNNTYGQTNVPLNLSNVVAIAAGDDHNLALNTNGNVIAWGRNTFNQTNVPTPVTNVVAVSAGGSQSLALRKDSTVVQWGQTNASIPSGLSNVTAIASGTNFHLALRSNSTVVAWGLNNFGQTNVPASASNVVAIAAGGFHALAVRANGTVVSWGANGSGQTNVPAGLSNVMAVAAGWKHSAALKNDGTVVGWGDNTFGQTNAVFGLGNVKSIAAGGDHTLAAIFSPLVQYPVDVTKDLLLIYNTNSVNSRVVKDYYLAHRPMVSGANVLGIGCMTNEITSTVDFTNQILAPYLNWLNQNPTKRPQYLILFPDQPSRVWGNVSNYLTISNSVAVGIHQGTPGIRPFVNSINTGLDYLGAGALTNDCIAYINKLKAFGTNYSPGKLFISASKGGYGNTNYVVDDVRHDNYEFQATVSSATNGLLAAGVLTNAIRYTTGVEVCITPNPTNSLICDARLNLPQLHLTNAVNVAGYICWGAHSSLGNEYSRFGPIRVKWTGNSSWWVIETIESFNGQRATGQGNFTQWFSADAFGGTNYSNTPIGAVSHTDEPGLFGVNQADVYFQLWAGGHSFANCAWNSRITPRFQAVGDPFVTK